jgi:hypothetical protein
MRYGRSLPQQPPKKRGFSSLIIVAVLIGITAYFVGAGAAGGWLAENVINPVFNSGVGNAATTSPSLSPNVSASATLGASTLPTASSTHSEEQITAQSVTLYTLQVGAFSDESNAKQAAQEVINRGGAGFVAFDGSLYRVLVAGYTSENDAQTVKTDLDKQSISTTIYKLESGALKFEIGAEQQQIDVIKACFNVVPSTVSELQQIVFSADKGENVDDRIAALKSKADEVTTNLKAVVSADSTPMSSLVKYMDSFCEKLGSIHKTADVSGVAFSSELKYNLINVVVDYSAFFKELSS